MPHRVCKKKIGTYRERERETERDSDQARGEERQRVMVNQCDSPHLQVALLAEINKHGENT